MCLGADLVVTVIADARKAARGMEGYLAALAAAREAPPQRRNAAAG